MEMTHGPGKPGDTARLTKFGYCPNCGANPENQARTHRRWQEAEKLYKQEAARHAITKAEFELHQLQVQGDESWVQAKVRRQAREIHAQNERYLQVLRTRLDDQEDT